MQGERVPVIHTVGFFAEEQRGGPGERFLRQLSALAGGTFQVSPVSYCPALPCPAIVPCSTFSCPALPCLGQPCPALFSLCITMLCPFVLLCCAALGYTRLQVPLHAVPVSPNASPPLVCCLSHCMLSLTLHAVSHNVCCLSQCKLSFITHLVLLHATCLPHS